MTRDDVITALGPVLDVVRTIDPADPEATDPAVEMQKIAELLKSRALVHGNTRRGAIPSSL